MSVHQAISSGRLNQTRLLLDVGVGVNSRNPRGQTPLVVACLQQREEIAVRMVKLLLRRCADKALEDKQKRNAFSYACELGREKIVALLMKEVDFDLNAQDVDGNTPLMYTAINGHAKIVRLLIARFRKYRINIDTRNNKGFTAYLLASKSGNFFCAHLLKTEGRASDSVRDTEFFLNAEEWSHSGENDDVEQDEVIPQSARPKTSPNARILSHRLSIPPLRTRSMTSPNLLTLHRPSMPARSLTMSRLIVPPFSVYSPIQEEPLLETLRKEKELPISPSSSTETFSSIDQTSPVKGQVLDLHKLFNYYERPNSSHKEWGCMPSKFLAVPSLNDIYKDR